MINLSVPATKFQAVLSPRITVIGVGGAGGNAVNNMIASELSGITFVAANTDAQALLHSHAEVKLQLGASKTKGLGAGAHPEIGRASAEEALKEIEDILKDTTMLFITAGMGGGTGTGASPVIARLAREMGILTIGVVTKPFDFEGHGRKRTAEAGIAEMSEYVDTLLIIPNQNLFTIADDDITFENAFKRVDDVLYQGVRSITDLMLIPGHINLDFNDVKTVMEGMGRAMMGTGEEEGQDRAIRAAERAMNNPLLDNGRIAGATRILINITGAPDMKLSEVNAIVNRIREELDEEANIIFGTCFDPTMDERIRVSIVATGLADAPSKKEPQRPSASAPSSVVKRSVREEIDVQETVRVSRPLHPLRGLGISGLPKADVFFKETIKITKDDETEIPSKKAVKTPVRGLDSEDEETLSSQKKEELPVFTPKLTSLKTPLFTPDVKGEKEQPEPDQFKAGLFRDSSMLFKKMKAEIDEGRKKTSSLSLFVSPEDKKDADIPSSSAAPKLSIQDDVPEIPSFLRKK